MDDSKRKFIATTGINKYKDGSTVIIQGEREFFEYMPGRFALFNRVKGKSFLYVQCPCCGLIWAAGCGFAKHKCPNEK